MTKVVIELSSSTIMFRHGDREYPVDVTELPQETLRRIFLYGRRMFNDTLNSQKTLSPSELLARYKAGEFKRGGRAADPVAAECRRLIEDALRRAGWKATDVADTFKGRGWRDVADDLGLDPDVVRDKAAEIVADRSSFTIKI